MTDQSAVLWSDILLRLQETFIQLGFNECDTRLSLAGVKTQAAPLMMKVGYKSFFYPQILTDHSQDYNKALIIQFDGIISF